jgi:hypothetical protein
MRLDSEPRLVWLGLGLCLAVAAGVTIWSCWDPELVVVAQVAQLAPVLFANIQSTRLGWLIAGEYAGEFERHTPMRLAWNLIAAGSLANAGRVGFELAFQVTGRTNSAVTIALGLRQILIVASLVLLSGGLAAMWSAFTSLRLGVRLRGVDWALIGFVLLLVPPVVLTRQRMNDAGSPLEMVRYMQFASPFLLAVPASLGLVLYRISREMGEGLMSLTLRFLAAFFALRLLVLAGRALPDHTSPVGMLVVATVPPLLVITAHWSCLLGLVYRRRLSHTTTDLIERYQGDQREQLAMLAKKIPSPGKQTGPMRQLQKHVVDFKLR